MKETTINLSIYEVGDVIQMNADDLSLEAKRRCYAGSRRAIVVGAEQRMDKLYTYKIIADNGKMITFTPREQGNERYIGHIDLSLLFEGENKNG